MINEALILLFKQLLCHFKWIMNLYAKYSGHAILNEHERLFAVDKYKHSIPWIQN